MSAIILFFLNEVSYFDCVVLMPLLALLFSLALTPLLAFLVVLTRSFGVRFDQGSDAGKHAVDSTYSTPLTAVRETQSAVPIATISSHQMQNTSGAGAGVIIDGSTSSGVEFRRKSRV